MPGFLDKAKQAAQQALDEAKKGIDTGQAKLDEAQAKRDTERLLAALGAAYFDHQRHGGTEIRVSQALAAVDAHVTQHGMVGFPADTTAPEGVAPPPAPAPSPASPPPPAPAPPSASAPPSAPAPPSGDSPYDVPPTP